MSFDFTEAVKESKVEEEIKALDPINMTPIEALNKLFELKKEVDKNVTK